MASLSVKTEGMDELLHRLEAFGQTSRDLNEVVAEAASTAIREHLVDENRKRPNKLGGKRSNFYTQASESITTKATRNRAEVSVTHPGFALRYFGGIVKPTKKKALAIPARAEAYGLGPREPGVPTLTPFYFKGDSNAFGGLKDSQDRVWYWLADKTEHKGDKSLLPSPGSLRDAASEALEDYTASFFEEP
jgi:hypothetical protein